MIGSVELQRKKKLLKIKICCSLLVDVHLFGGMLLVVVHFLIVNDLGPVLQSLAHIYPF